jgi:hypothetical protein
VCGDAQQAPTLENTLRISKNLQIAWDSLLIDCKRTEKPVEITHQDM